MTLLDRITASQVNYWGGFALDLIVATWLFATRTPAAGPVAVAAIAAGLAAYSFYEYALHRWLYHGPPNPVRRLHTIHHEDRTARLGAPFYFSLSVCAITWAVASLVVDRSTAAVFAATILAAYAAQSAVHHIAHGWAGTTRLRGRLVRRWRRHHLTHHRDGDVNFGILTTFWDHVFRTTSGRRTSR